MGILMRRTFQTPGRHHYSEVPCLALNARAKLPTDIANRRVYHRYALLHNERCVLPIEHERLEPCSVSRAQLNTHSTRAVLYQRCVPTRVTKLSRHLCQPEDRGAHVVALKRPSCVWSQATGTERHTVDIELSPNQRHHAEQRSGVSP
jgi:hypothetical protein